VDLAGSEKVGKTGAAGTRLDEAKSVLLFWDIFEDFAAILGCFTAILGCFFWGFAAILGHSAAIYFLASTIHHGSQLSQLLY
jgi:glycerol-3-phosphate acyltransferase PlsY